MSLYKMKLIIILITILFIFCSEPVKHKITVIHIYKEEVVANDGVIEHDWMSLIQLENGSREQWRGKWSKIEGDTFIRIYDSGRWK